MSLKISCLHDWQDFGDEYDLDGPNIFPSKTAPSGSGCHALQSVLSKLFVLPRLLVLVLPLFALTTDCKVIDIACATDVNQMRSLPSMHAEKERELAH